MHTDPPAAAEFGTAAEMYAAGELLDQLREKLAHAPMHAEDKSVALEGLDLVDAVVSRRFRMLYNLEATHAAIAAMRAGLSADRVPATGHQAPAAASTDGASAEAGPA